MHLRTCTLLTALLAASAHAQSTMPGMTMPPQADSMPNMDGMQPARTFIDSILQHTSSGTSAEPPSTPMAMHMFGERPAGWRLMVHGIAFVADTQQHATTTPADPIPCPATPCPIPQRRGSDKFFSTNWIMPMAQHRLGPHGQLTLRTMLTLEPATITAGQYPELFQQGETVNGNPIIDGQHPHDFVMELAALYDLRIGEHNLLSLYAAPVGDPAIGPTAYPHRLSASEDPIAALGHHQEDSTHIAFNVLTAGFTHAAFRAEVSGFHGAEPATARWHFQPSPNGLTPDSYSTRLTYTPSANLTAQYSIAHLTAPEQLHPTENQRRQTASVMVNRPVGIHHDTKSMPGMDMATPATGNWSTTVLWGQAHTLATPQSPATTANSYLLESLLSLNRNHYWTRMESAARTDELYGPNLAPAEESVIGHVQAYSAGYDRDFPIGRHILAAPGAQFTLYRTPDALTPIYGRTPFGAVAFLRLRIAN